MEDRSDDLVEKAVRGDEAALVMLLEDVCVTLHAELEASIGARYRGLVSADDVLQVTCLEAFLRIRSFEPRGTASFAAWVKRISDNNLKDAIRELEREKRPSPGRRVSVRPGDESYAMLVEQLEGTATSITRAVSRNELQQVVEVALRKLPTDYESVLRLFELEGLSAPEVAERMNRSHGAVRMLLSRARDCLGELLGSESRFF